MSVFRAFSRLFVTVAGDGSEIYLRSFKRIGLDEVKALFGGEASVSSIGNRNGFILKFENKERAAEFFDSHKGDEKFVVRFAHKGNDERLGSLVDG